MYVFEKVIFFIHWW